MPIPTASSVQPALRRIFDRRAADFDRVGFLPREIAQRMSERLAYIKATPQRIVDAGCATGSDRAALTGRYPTAQWIGVDLSIAMLQRAQHRAAHDSANPSGQRLSHWLPESLRRIVDRVGSRKPTVIQADFADLPLAAESVDMIWSNLALQWHAKPDQVFPEWQRVLTVGGLLMFSTLGPDSLQELREAWREADAASGPTAKASLSRTVPPAPRRAPVLDFVDMHDFGDMLVASGFELPVMDMEHLTITYRDAEALLADVRAWGAMLPEPPRDPVVAATLALSDHVEPAGLTGRRRHAALLAALDRRRQADGTIPLTFEIIYGHAWKAALRVNAAGQAIVRIDDIGGRRRRQGG